MYYFLLKSHSGFRYIVLALLVAVLASSLSGWLGKRSFTKLDNKISLFFFISVHSMLLVGLILYFVSPRVHFGPTTMSDAATRYWTVEHISANLVAIALFTVARIRSKKQTTDLDKHRMLFVFTFVGFILLMASLTAGIYAPGLFGSSVH
jgi:cytochrome bd-type quinol oxidase subunit 2